MKVKCIKDTIGFKKGDIIEANSKGFIGSKNFLDNFEWYYKTHTEYFQEQEEEETIKPRWKVGDYIVNRGTGKYMKIISIFNDGKTIYYDGSTEEYFRDPTQEELKLYFR